MKRLPLNDLIFFLVFLPFISVSHYSLAQENERISFQSRILDEDFNAIEGASIKNLNTLKVVSSDSSGFFSIPSNLNDSILISGLGYEVKKVFVSTIPLPFIVLKQIVFSLKQVDVFEFKNWEAFKKEFIEAEIPGEKVNVTGLPAGKPSQKPIPLRSNTFESKPGILHFIQSPFSSLAYYTSNKEKSKRNVWRKMIQENNEMTYWSSMHRDSIKSWTNIPDSLIDDFVVYCNQIITDKQIGAVYYYKERIVKLYPDYLNQRDQP